MRVACRIVTPGPKFTGATVRSRKTIIKQAYDSSTGRTAGRETRSAESSLGGVALVFGALSAWVSMPHRRVGAYAGTTLCLHSSIHSVSVVGWAPLQLSSAMRGPAADTLRQPLINPATRTVTSYMALLGGSSSPQRWRTRRITSRPISREFADPRACGHISALVLEMLFFGLAWPPGCRSS